MSFPVYKKLLYLILEGVIRTGSFVYSIRRIGF